MSVKKLTARYVEGVKSDGNRIDIRDAGCPGLQLRVTGSGAKSWSLLYRTAKGRGVERRRLALGSYPAVSLEAARTTARQKLGEIAAGRDPADESARRNAEAPFTTMANRYLEKHSRPKKRSWKSDEAIMAADVLPVIGKMRPRDISREQIEKVIERPLGRGAPVQANRTFDLLRAIFRWGTGTYLDLSPCYGMRKPTRERPRERVLTDEELRIVWHAFDYKPASGGMTEGVAIAGRLMILLGQRSSEVTQAERCEIDWERRVWCIPGHRAKNSKPNPLPLPSMAVALFSRAFELGQAERRPGEGLTNASAYVFPAPFGRGSRPWGAAPISKTAVHHALRRALKSTSLKDVRPHDFRRTVATRLAQLGHPEGHIAAVLNHSRTSVTAKHYAHYGYDSEKLSALDAWQEHLLAIVQPTEGSQ